MAITLDGTSGITTPTYGGTDTSEYLVPVTAFKNRIINGAMMIDQRNAGASVTPTTAQYTVDRFRVALTQASKFTVQQNAGSVTPPAGFKNYLGITSSSAYSVLTGDFFLVGQPVEGFNTADLAFGSASAATVTLSFWVRSSLTGTFGGSINNSAYDRSYPFSYTISSANTWEQKTVTITGDTSGTWLTTNGVGLYAWFNLGTGSTGSGTAGAWSASALYAPTGATSVVGTSGATFYITGVQLEKGSTATSFDYRPYGTELALCQRYLPAFYGNANSIIGQAINSTAAYVSIPFLVTPRVAPTGITTTAISGSNFILTNTTSVGLNVTSINLQQASTSNMLIAPNVASGLTSGSASIFVINTAGGAIFATGCEL